MTAGAPTYTSWQGYATLIAACFLAFRLLYLWLSYSYFWVNAWREALAFALVLAVHFYVRPQTDQFRKGTRRLVLVTLFAMGALLLIAFMFRMG